MATSWNKFDRYMLFVNKSGCSYYKKANKWQGKCILDNSRRKYGCWKSCPNCKLSFKDRTKIAWHILTWKKGVIRQCPIKN